MTYEELKENLRKAEREMKDLTSPPDTPVKRMLRPVVKARIQHLQSAMQQKLKDAFDKAGVI